MLNPEWTETLRSVASLLTAFLFAIPVGWERAREGRRPGLRTFPLVAVGACAFVIIGRAAFQGHPEAESRIMQGLLAGIGFVGAGAIFKSRHEVHGLAGAVSVWITAAIGASVAYGRLTLAVTLSLVTFATLWFVRSPGGRTPRAS